MTKQFKVSSNTKVRQLAGAIERAAHRDGSLELVAMGSKAVNKAVVATTLANKYISKRDKYLSCTPYFEKKYVDGKQVDMLRIVVGAIND